MTPIDLFPEEEEKDKGAVIDLFPDEAAPIVLNPEAFDISRILNPQSYPEPRKRGVDFWKGLQEVAAALYRPIGAALKMESERITGERPFWQTFITKPTDYWKKVFGPLEDIEGKAITSPVVLKALKEMPPDLAIPLGTLYYGGIGGKPDAQRIVTALLKTKAARGELGDIGPEDIPAQLSPAGVINFSIDMLGLDLFIPQSWGLKVYKGISETARGIRGVEEFASLFSRHLGKGKVVNQIGDDMLRKLNAFRGAIFDTESDIAKAVNGILKRYDVPVDKGKAIISDIVERYKPPTPGAGGVAPSRSLRNVIEETFPVKGADVDTLTNATQHYIDLGAKVPELERAVGLPIRQLMSEDMNYLLHYVTDSVRPLLRKQGLPKEVVKTFDETRLLSDIFHPSLKTRAMDMTIKEANAIAAEGRMFVKAGKIGTLKSVDEALPLGAVKISKLFDDDTARLAFIRQERAARAITSKQYLDRVFDALPDYAGPNATTLKHMLGTRRWDKTFGLMGEAAEQYATKPLDPKIARDLMFGFHRLHDFRLIDKGPFLKVHDAFMNWWKPLQLYAFQQYHTRNFSTALWNEYMNDNFWGFLQGLFEIVSHERLVNHPLFREIKNWGGFGRSQFTADLEKLSSGMSEAASMKKDIVDGVLGIATGGIKGNMAKLGEFFENTIRFSSYIGWRNKGYGPQEAVRQVMKAQFDYLDLTSFEWNIMRRGFWFYTFTRKNIPFQLERLFARPGKALAPLRGMLGAAPEMEPGEEKTLSPIIGERSPIKVGENQYIALEDTWALTDITKFFSKDALQEIVNMASPLLKIPFEQFSRTVDGRWTGWGSIGEGEMTGYSLFTKRPIKPWWKESDDVWGRPLPVKVASLLENNFRIFRHIEKMPWYPEDEGKPIGQSKYAKGLQMWGIPYYENHPQQQIYWRIKEIEQEQESMGGMTISTKDRYKNLAFEKIWLRGKEDQMLEPFRGGKRIIQQTDAVLDELSAMTGVDMKALRGKYGDKWRDEAVKSPNIFVDFQELREQFPGYTDDQLRKEAFKILEDEAKSKAFFKGGIENYADAINTITNLLADDMREKTFKRSLLTDDEVKWLQGSLISVLNKGVEYLDFNRRQGNFEWYPYSDKLKEWTEFIYARTGQMPKQLQEVHERMAMADYQKLKAQYPEMTKDGLEKVTDYAMKQTTNSYLTTESKDKWMDEWVNLNMVKLENEWATRNFSSFEGGSKLANMIKDDSLPIEIRRQFGRYYAIKMKALIDAGVRTKQSWGWVEDNIVPLFQGSD